MIRRERATRMRRGRRPSIGTLPAGDPGQRGGAPPHCRREAAPRMAAQLPQHLFDQMPEPGSISRRASIIQRFRRTHSGHSAMFLPLASDISCQPSGTRPCRRGSLRPHEEQKTRLRRLSRGSSIDPTQLFDASSTRWIAACTCASEISASSPWERRIASSIFCRTSSPDTDPASTASSASTIT